MNRDLLSKIMIFAAGAAIGSVATWKLVKTKYEQIAQEEIDSVKEAFSNREALYGDTEGEPEDDTDEEIDHDEYREIVENEGYTTENEEEVETDMKKPYVISPEEFGECDYEMITLHYYTDGVVTNEQHKIVENVDELVGEDFDMHFGDYEEDPDSVYVRNDEMEIDFEILKDYRDYSEIS